MYTIEIEDPSKLFFTSDTHFGHFHIASLCERPFESRSEMDRGLIERWNSVVPEDGIVVHCGDFMLPHKEGMKEYLPIFRKLNGKILLCRGNHDKIPIMLEQTENLIASVDCAMIKVGDLKIYAQHYPCIAFPANYQVFGHIHTLKDGRCHGIDDFVNDIIRKNQYDVGVDQNGYTPVSYEQLMKIFEQKKI